MVIGLLELFPFSDNFSGLDRISRSQPYQTVETDSDIFCVRSYPIKLGLRTVIEYMAAHQVHNAIFNSFDMTLTLFQLQRHRALRSVKLQV